MSKMFEYRIGDDGTVEKVREVGPVKLKDLIDLKLACGSCGQILPIETFPNPFRELELLRKIAKAVVAVERGVVFEYSVSDKKLAEFWEALRAWKEAKRDHFGSGEARSSGSAPR